MPGEQTIQPASRPIASGQQSTIASGSMAGSGPQVAPGNVRTGGVPAGSTPPSSWTPQDPSYSWRLGQGVDAINRGAAVRGNLMTGATLTDLMDYGQGLASTEYQNQWQRGYQDRALDFNQMDANRKFQFGSLYDMAQMGLGATNSYGNIYGDMTTGAANAGAAGQVAQGNAWGNVANTAGKLGSAAWTWAQNRNGQNAPTDFSHGIN